MRSKMRYGVFLLAVLVLVLGGCQKENAVRMYLPVVEEHDGEEVLFSFIYLDEDEVPELVAWDSYYEKYYVYTIKDGSAVCLVDGMGTVEMTYYEKKNVIAVFSRWNGGGDEGGYASAYYQLDQYAEAVTDDSIPSFQDSYQAVYDENGEWTGTGITDYYEKEEKIDEAGYRQLAVDFGIAESERVSCFGEESFTKDELLTYIDALK